MEKKRSGFTLIEILVVVTIISVLSVGGLLLFAQGQRASRDARRRTDVTKIMEALEQNYLYTNAYPNVGDTTCNLVPGLSTFFPSGIPTDPKGVQYSCKNRDNGGNVNTSKFCVYSSLEVLSVGNCNANCVSASGGTSACAFSN